MNPHRERDWKRIAHERELALADMNEELRIACGRLNRAEQAIKMQTLQSWSRVLVFSAATMLGAFAAVTLLGAAVPPTQPKPVPCAERATVTSEVTELRCWCFAP